MANSVEKTGRGNPFVSKKRLSSVIGIIWAVYTLAYLSHVFFYLGLMISPLTHRAISVGMISILVFLHHPPPFIKRGKTPGDVLSWHEILLVLVIITGCGYVAVQANELISQGRMVAHTYEMVLGAVLFLSVIEAARRTVGLVVPFIGISAFFYTIYSNYFPGFLHSSGFPYSWAFGWMYLGDQGFWGMIVGVVSTVVAGFIIFGGFLKALGASHFFTQLSLAIAGSLRGGPGKAAIVASTFFGTISGSIAANIATTGQITIPMMTGTGFKKNFAGAVETAASTGGMFTPPVMGATAFLMAEFLAVSYWNIVVAAVLPAVVFYIVLFIQVHLEAVRLGLEGLPKSELPSLKTTLKSGWHFLLPFVVLIYLLGFLKYGVQTAIMYTLASLIVVSLFKKENRLTLPKLADALSSGAQGMMPIIPLCAVIGILVGAVEITGAGTAFTSRVLSISGGNIFVLLLMSALAAFLLGMGMTAVSVYLLTVVLLAPALINAGIEPMAAHFFLFYFGCLSFITPPVCVGAFIAAGISGGNPWRTGVNAMLLGSAAFLVPWGFVYYPGILMIGDPSRIAAETVIVMIGATAVGIACAGRIFTPFHWVERILLGFSGVFMFVPYIPVKALSSGFLIFFLAKQLFHLFRLKFRSRGNSQAH